jgi:hypothetical protein
MGKDDEQSELNDKYNPYINWYSYDTKELVMPYNIDKIVAGCMKNKKIDFIVLPVSMYRNGGAHANMVIYSKRNNTVERFEPHGSDRKESYNSYLMDIELKKKFKKLFPKAMYSVPSDYLPNLGFQSVDVKFKRDVRAHPGGFCASWSLWYIDLRLSNPDIIDIQKLVQLAMRSLDLNNKNYSQFINEYSNSIGAVRDSILAKIDTDIDRFNNKEITNEQYTKLIEGTIAVEINSLVKRHSSVQ